MHSIRMLFQLCPRYGLPCTVVSVYHILALHSGFEDIFLLAQVVNASSGVPHSHLAPCEQEVLISFRKPSP